MLNPLKPGASKRTGGSSFRRTSADPTTSPHSVSAQFSQHDAGLPGRLRLDRRWTLVTCPGSSDTAHPPDRVPQAPPLQDLRGRSGSDGFWPDGQTNQTWQKKQKRPERSKTSRQDQIFI